MGEHGLPVRDTREFAQEEPTITARLKKGQIIFSLYAQEYKGIKRVKFLHEDEKQQPQPRWTTKHDQKKVGLLEHNPLKKGKQYCTLYSLQIYCLILIIYLLQCFHLSPNVNYVVYETNFGLSQNKSLCRENQLRRPRVCVENISGAAPDSCRSTYASMYRVFVVCTWTQNKLSLKLLLKLILNGKDHQNKFPFICSLVNEHFCFVYERLVYVFFWAICTLYLD